MQKTYLFVAALSGLALGGCDTAVAPEPAQSSQQGAAQGTVAEALAPAEDGTHRFAAWQGRWTGVEGMYVDIMPTTAETYRLQMQYDLDNAGEFVGRDSEHGIKFIRSGETLSLRSASGDETGLKYLAGKRDCLIVKEGEGYCRD